MKLINISLPYPKKIDNVRMKLTYFPIYVDIYKLNSENETAEGKASILLKNGLVKLSSNSNLLDKDTLNVLRDELEKTFQLKEYPRQIDLHLIQNKLIEDTIFKSLSNKRIKEFFKELSKQTGHEITVFPFIDVMRNYFSGPQCGFDGLHNDAEENII